MCPKACHVRLNEPIDAAYAQDGQPRSICDGSGGMRRVFADEFDNATLDEATWEVVEGWSAQTNSMTRSGWGDKAEAYLDGAGHLVLRTRRATPQEWAMHAGQPGWKGYYTGAVSTRGRRAFAGPGRLCVSARLPGDSSEAARAAGRNVGLWPAIWLMPIHANDFDQSLGCWPDLGEIDLAEMVNGEPSWYGTYHWSAEYEEADGSGGPGAPQSTPRNRCRVANGKSGHAEVQRCVPLTQWDCRFHEYAVEWDGKDSMRFFINAVLIGEVTAGQTQPTRPPDNVEPSSAKWLPKFHADPMYLMLQTAVGGGWPGEPRDSTQLPVHHLVDYVRYEAAAG